MATRGNEEVGTHEFSGNGENVERCRFCGGYPFDVQHWTI